MEPHDLYGLPLERFTPERNALAKTLRGEGNREGAGRVARLRKPSVAAWAVNQLVRTQRNGVAALFDAGDALQLRQSELLEGRGDAAALRQAVANERRAVEKLTDTARGLLSNEGHELTPPRLEQVAETLHAAALDEDARRQVSEGCLERELRHVGMGAVDAPARQSAPQRSRRADPGGKRGRSERLKAVRQAEAEARRRADRASRELDTAQQRRDRSAEALREAEEVVATARDRAAEAAREHRRTRRELEGSS